MKAAGEQGEVEKGRCFHDRRNEWAIDLGFPCNVYLCKAEFKPPLLEHKA